MATFKFKAEKSTGEVYEGTRTAPDKFTLYQDMKREGEIVVYAEEMKEKSPLLRLSFLKGLLNGVSMRDRIQLARKRIAVLLRERASLVEDFMRERGKGFPKVSQSRILPI